MDSICLEACVIWISVGMMFGTGWCLVLHQAHPCLCVCRTDFCRPLCVSVRTCSLVSAPTPDSITGLTSAIEKASDAWVSPLCTLLHALSLIKFLRLPGALLARQQRKRVYRCRCHHFASLRDAFPPL